MAQLGSAFGWGPKGRRFKSGRPDYAEARSGSGLSGFKTCHMSPQMVPWYQSRYQAAKAWIWGTKGREFKFSTGQLFECISDSSDVGAVVISVQ